MSVLNSLREMFDETDAYIHGNNSVGKAFEFIEAKTKVSRTILLRGSLAFVAVWLVIGYGSKVVCHLIGFAYPAYASVLAIETPSKDDDTRWLIYWVVFGLFCCVEFFFDIILFWFPLYNLVKCAFLLWCFAPSSYNGTTMIYYNIVRPYFLKYEQEIDEKLMVTTKLIRNTARDIADKATAVIEDQKPSISQPSEETLQQDGKQQKENDAGKKEKETGGIKERKAEETKDEGISTQKEEVAEYEGVRHRSRETGE